MMPSSQPTSVETEVLKDVSHQHHVFLYVESAVATPRG